MTRSAVPGRGWRKVFVGGLLLWLATVAVTLVTGNPVLVPTLVLLGSFLVPVTFVLWAVGRWRDEHLTVELWRAGRAGAAGGDRAGRADRLAGGRADTAADPGNLRYREPALRGELVRTDVRPPAHRTRNNDCSSRSSEAPQPAPAGPGLGLSIVRAVVTAHDGEISSTTLPSSKPSATPSPSTSPHNHRVSQDPFHAASRRVRRAAIPGSG
jgi:hypothetical protein